MDECHIAAPKIDLLVYLVDTQVYTLQPPRFKPSKQTLQPSNKTELQAFLDLLNFYNVFLPHKTSVAKPLHHMLDKKSAWSWGSKEAASFKAVKALLSTEIILVQYNELRPLVLA